MLRDLNEAWGWIQRLVRRVSRLESGAMLENASITNGRLRIIGGTLRVDSGGSVVIVGTLAIDGTTTVTGTFTVSGPWNLSGTGTISGNVTITGNVTATGTLTQNGPWNLNGVGTIAGNVTQTGNTTQQGNVTLTGGGKVTAGNVRVEPNKLVVGGADGDTTFTNSQIQFANGGIVATDSSGGISMRVGSARVRVADGVVQMTIGTRSIVINAGGISAGLPTAPLANWPGRQVGDVVSNASGDLFRIV